MDTDLHEQPLLWQRVEKKRGPGAAQPHCGAEGCVHMAWIPVFLMFLFHCTGSLSQPVLTQPPSLSASLGASTRLTCTLSNGFSLVATGCTGTSRSQRAFPSSSDFQVRL